MTPAAEETLQEALAAFRFGGAVESAVRYGSGHINDTFRVTVRTPDGSRSRVILQRMSAAAFRRPDQLMKNLVRVTDYLREQLPATEKARTLRVLRTRSGAASFTDRLGGAWRAFPFLEHTVCFQSADSPELFAASGYAFGSFQRMLAGFPADTLYETIPDFHHTPKRLARLKDALRADAFGRAGEAARETAFLLAREADCQTALTALSRGLLPLRVTHNDTKLDNILFDVDTKKAVCIIDLDTVMPGLVIYDFGDSIRFGANRCAEDEPDCSKAVLDLSLFRCYTEAFLAGAGGVLTPEEIRYLPWGARLMTLECGIRFLTDYLEGDVYFHTSRPRQNLDRCRTQLHLVQDMEENWAELERIVRQTASIESREDVRHS